MLTTRPEMHINLQLLVVSDNKTRVERVGLKVAHLLSIWRVVELPEAVLAEVAWVLGGKLIVACYPAGPKYATDMAFFLPWSVFEYQMGIVFNTLAV